MRLLVSCTVLLVVHRTEPIGASLGEPGGQVHRYGAAHAGGQPAPIDPRCSGCEPGRRRWYVGLICCSPEVVGERLCCDVPVLCSCHHAFCLQSLACTLILYFGCPNCAVMASFLAGLEVSSPTTGGTSEFAVGAGLPTIPSGTTQQSSNGDGSGAWPAAASTAYQRSSPAMFVDALMERCRALLDSAARVDVSNDMSSQSTVTNRHYCGLILTGLALMRAKVLGTRVERIYCRPTFHRTPLTLDIDPASTTAGGPRPQQDRKSSRLRGFDSSQSDSLKSSMSETGHPLDEDPLSPTSVVANAHIPGVVINKATYRAIAQEGALSPASSVCTSGQQGGTPHHAQANGESPLGRRFGIAIASYEDDLGSENGSRTYSVSHAHSGMGSTHLSPSTLPARSPGLKPRRLRNFASSGDGSNPSSSVSSGNVRFSSQRRQGSNSRPKPGSGANSGAASMLSGNSGTGSSGTGNTAGSGSGTTGSGSGTNGSGTNSGSGTTGTGSGTTGEGSGSSGTSRQAVRYGPSLGDDALDANSSLHLEPRMSKVRSWKHVMSQSTIAVLFCGLWVISAFH